MENIRFFAEVRGLKASFWKERCMQILTFVGLDSFTERRAGQLSGGMKQKLGLAAALVHEPQVLLLDEPTTGVDPVTRQDFWQLIIRLAGSGTAGQAHKNGGTAVLISTPYMDEATRCTKLGFMRLGKMVMVGTPSELRKPLKGQILEVIGQPLPKLRLLVRDVPGVRNVQMFGDRLHLQVEPGEMDALLNRLANWLPAQECEVKEIRPIEPQLEDVFISLLEE